MGAFIVASAPSSHDVAQKPPTPGKAAGSPDESNTKSQKPHDAFFMNKRALETGLWKKWLATILILQRKTNEKRRRKTNM